MQPFLSEWTTMSRIFSLVVSAFLLPVMWVSSPACGGDFTDVAVSLPGMTSGAAVWGDYDNDGDLDLVFVGRASSSGHPYTAEIYRNDNGNFVAINAGLTPVSYAGLCLGDYDNDGDLDLFLAGYDTTDTPVARIYRNDGSDVFTPIAFSGAGVSTPISAWVDYDGDGDLDLAYSGLATGIHEFSLYRNDGGDSFTYVSTGIPAWYGGSIEWGDYDNDGDKDILIMGDSGIFGFLTSVYRNDGNGTFSEVSSPFVQLFSGNAVWGDYDQDGDLDVYINGAVRTGQDDSTKVYENVGGDNFVDIGATLPQSGEGATFDIGDVDGDGDFDALITSVFLGNENLYYYLGDSTFVAASGTMQSGCCGAAAFADFDNDNDLDFYISYYFNSGHLFRNDLNIPNTVPTAPAGLSATVLADTASLSWDAASDNETASAGLTYNVRIGTTPGGIEVVSPMSDLSSGYRRIVARGNADQRLAFNVSGLADGVYYWSVQAIDNNFAGSPFSAEGSFAVSEAPYTCGDASADGVVSIGDAVFVINYIFGGGPAPVHAEAADADCSGSISIADAVYIINFIFGGGPPPCSSC